MLLGQCNNGENSQQEDDVAPRKMGGRRNVININNIVNKYTSVGRVVFAVIFLGSIVISGVGWLTDNPGYPKRPWSVMWFMFGKAHPYGSDTRVYLVLENGEEQEVDMNQWFKYEVVPQPLIGSAVSKKRYSALPWDDYNTAKLAAFVAQKSRKSMLKGRLKMVKVVHRWWPITRGRRPTEADRTNGQTKIQYIRVMP